MGVGRRAVLTLVITQEERLWVSDPKATHHILQGSGYLYEKSRATSERFATVMDRGLIVVEGKLFFFFHILFNIPLTPTQGDVHKRQRRAMVPAFGLVEAKALYPYFVRCSGSVSGFSVSVV